MIAFIIRLALLVFGAIVVLVFGAICLIFGQKDAASGLVGVAKDLLMKIKSKTPAVKAQFVGVLEEKKASAPVLAAKVEGSARRLLKVVVDESRKTA